MGVYLDRLLGGAGGDGQQQGGEGAASSSTGADVSAGGLVKGGAGRGMAQRDAGAQQPERGALGDQRQGRLAVAQLPQSGSPSGASAATSSSSSSMASGPPARIAASIPESALIQAGRALRGLLPGGKVRGMPYGA